MTDAAPKRIWVSAPNEDNEVETWTDPDEGGTEYILASEVAALIAEAEARVWERAAEMCRRYITPYGRAGSAPDAAEGAVHGMGDALLAEVAAIRAAKGETT